MVLVQGCEWALQVLGLPHVHGLVPQGNQQRPVGAVGREAIAAQERAACLPVTRC